MILTSKLQLAHQFADLNTKQTSSISVTCVNIFSYDLPQGR